VVGVVCHESTKPRDWTRDERDFAASVAGQVARQLEEAARHDAEARERASAALAGEFRRMEALGHLAAGVAHDFRNVLTVVKGFASEIQRQAPSPRLTEAARQILQAAERGVALTQSLLDFGRDERRGSRVLDVGEVLEGIAPMLQKLVGRAHPIEIRRQPPIGRVLIDPNQLERVVMNLVRNARDAMAESGDIVITTSEASVPDDPEDDHDRPGVYVVVEVADRGVGMDAETCERIFEPFFTTREAADGTGIGLSIAYTIVERAGGFIGVDSQPGRGTRMRVYLPRVAV
jgi:signal transduction histidine kinase